ncbi:dTDP-4-dehydrorhamnose reductase [Gammaproteobacteria bacterium]|nr:dTDP-4-dehydrorhamnose reductase [Gammaproteobacteria bacterium]
MKILVLGSKGQLGRSLNDQFSNTDYEVFYASREQINVANFEETKASILQIAPGVIINATAYTAVDKAEQYKEQANFINHLAVANLANICKENNCWLIHVSTDYVFDGNSKFPYKEEDKTNPQSVYGQSKLNGELAIQSSGCKHIIIRTAWIFSEYGDNFLKTMLKLGASKNEVNIVDDQIGCPTYAQDLAYCIVKIIPNLFFKETIQGIYHYCGNTSCSWYDFATIIYNEAKLLGYKTPELVIPINTSKYPTPAHRPSFSVLDCSKIKFYFDISCSDWKLGIKRILSLD